MSAVTARSAMERAGELARRVGAEVDLRTDEAGALVLVARLAAAELSTDVGEQLRALQAARVRALEDELSEKTEKVEALERKLSNRARKGATSATPAASSEALDSERLREALEEVEHWKRESDSSTQTIRESWTNLRTLRKQLDATERQLEERTRALENANARIEELQRFRAGDAWGNDGSTAPRGDAQGRNDGF